ncbi:MAG: TIGR00341 family protein [bacterium]|nr:TIGR00341 family protein [bacterium]MDA1024423.1 TIGR00341 family protein [bacterium]
MKLTLSTKEVKHEAVLSRLIQDSSPRITFLILILVSSIIAALGLLNDSASIVIGAMLVAPLLWPVLGISMGLLVRDWAMIKLSLISVLISIVIAIAIAIWITSYYVPIGASNEILQQTNLSFMIPVAIASGIAAALALCFDHIKEAVSGIAISVALLPPLVTIGIGLGGADWGLVQKSAELFFINLVAIIASSFAVFALLGFYYYSSAADKEARKEERRLKKVV